MLSDDKQSLVCLNCGRTELEIPLVALRYDGAENWICSQCLPILIHKPYQLAGKLRDASQMVGSDHQD